MGTFGITQRYELFNQALIIASRRSRHDLLSDLTAFMPFILSLGDYQLPNKIHYAVRDVTACGHETFFVWNPANLSNLLMLRSYGKTIDALCFLIPK
jgi:hypothetical protein